MSGFNLAFLIFFIIYVCVLLGISLYRTRGAQEMADHVLGGRQAGAITTGLSASSSLERGWALLVLPAIALEFGFLVLIIGCATIVFGMWSAWRFMAPRIRRFTTGAQNALTLPELFERRFMDSTGALRVLAALLTIFFVIFYVSAGLLAGGRLLYIVFGLDVKVGGLITLLIVLSYIFLGGYMVVVRTDVFQSLLTIVGVLVLIAAMLFVTSNAAAELSTSFSQSWDHFISGGETDGVALAPVFLFLIFLAFTQGVYGAQRLMYRFMAVKSEAIMVPSRRISSTWIFVLLGSCLLLGLVADIAFTQQGFLAERALIQESADEGRHGGTMLFYMSAQLFLNPVVGAFALTAIAAAVMSTIDSQLLVGSAVATTDLPFVRNFGQRRRFVYVLGAFARVWIGRLILIFIGVASWLLAIVQPQSVIALLSYAWVGMGGVFGPITILTLYWRRFNIWGAYAGLIVGGLITIVCTVMGIHPFMFGVLMVFVAPIVVVVTLLTSKPSAEVVGLFDQLVEKPGPA